jgi:hypothetical protein
MFVDEVGGTSEVKSHVLITSSLSKHLTSRPLSFLHSQISTNAFALLFGVQNSPVLHNRLFLLVVLRAKLFSLHKVLITDTNKRLDFCILPVILDVSR